MGIMGYLAFFVVFLFVTAIVFLVKGIKNKSKKYILLSVALFVIILGMYAVFLWFVTGM